MKISTCRINKGRIIDLSRGAARALGSGDLAPVCIRVLKYGDETVRLRETSFHGRLGLAARLARAADLSVSAFDGIKSAL